MAFDGHYLDWNQKRIKGIVDFYGYKFMYGKKILDLGCGYADISGVLHRLGADVTAVDARNDHLKIVNKKFSGIKTIHADLDRGWPLEGKQFDLTLDLGLLCHLANYESHLRSVCASTTYLVLETAVCDSNDPYKCITVSESKGIYDLSANGLGCRPSVAAIERILLENGMSFQRMDSAKLNAARYSYDWVSINNNDCDIYRRRIWFAIKDTTSPRQQRAPLVSPAPTQIHYSTNAMTVIAPPLNSTPLSVRAGYKPSPVPPLNVPVYPPPPAPTPRVTTRPASNKPKMRLFYNYYMDKNPARKQEIDLCLQKNIENGIFDLVILDFPERPTFDSFFERINRLAGPNDISIICSPDIFFDRTIELAEDLGSKQVYALSHWNWHKNGNSDLDEAGRQDTWIFKGKIEGVMGDIPFDAPGSDGRIAFELSQAGYTVLNPGRAIKTYHFHEVIDLTREDIVQGSYLRVDPLGL